MGNFPRIEIVLDCAEFGHVEATDDPTYTKLVNLKKLLDNGVITQAEFDAEKTKVLSQH